jgi:hypothetical protein
MCQTKAEGGKRCAAHMSGSTATVTMASIIADVQEPAVKKVFTALRKEGKKLPAPTPEEVYALSENNAMMAKFDPSIPDSRRKKLVEKWENAKSESPDGGTFHAWRHTLAETFRRGRKIFAATGIAGALIFTSSCSSSGALGHSGPTDTSSPTSISQTATPSASPTASAATLPAGIIAKGAANDGKGIYLQTSIADTDPAMKYNPAITDDAAKAHYSEADLAEAQKVIVKFIAEEAIDSSLNGGGTDVDGWFAAHKDEILPANQAPMLNDIKSNTGDVIARESWMATKPGYSYVHGDNTPRVTARTITPTKFRYVESGSLQGVMLDTNVSYSMKVTGGSHSGVQSTTGTVSFAVAKDPADGKWKIAGYNTHYTTAEG